MLMRQRLDRPINISVIAVFSLALIFGVRHNFAFSAGILVGASWLMANFLLTINLLEIAVLKRAKNKLLLLLLIKFPVLYLLGFLVITWNILPVASLLTGMSLVILVLGVSGIWPSKQHKPNMNCRI
ncbi:MAG: hypothetical protein V1869_02680 [Candidatus Omnitrophota bacterium]